mmetsp:Transcript_25789/g.71047  ORF Transcript_25789/g.71047 Transcript_25789/m.71047 type:complete len:87 (+) Transcript_25789:547-807(+)
MVFKKTHGIVVVCNEITIIAVATHLEQSICWVRSELFVTTMTHVTPSSHSHPGRSSQSRLSDETDRLALNFFLFEVFSLFLHPSHP